MLSHGIFSIVDVLYIIVVVVVVVDDDDDDDDEAVAVPGISAWQWC